ncbi:alpha/beta-hydrolase [Stipitochalara longipes BDJ]|nr:alpha/beta-hydrolase [Stipitochalara longipes BDJ]
MASSISSYGTVDAGAERLYFEQEGNKSGPAILFIHGLGGTTNAYQSLMGALQDFNLVRFDWAGHGRSSIPKATSIDSYVDNTLAVIKHCDLRNITVVGHSLGGLVALTLASKYPSLVSKLVLFGPVKPPPQAGKDGLNARASTVRDAGMAKVADTVISNAFAPKTLKERTEIVAFAREMLCRQDPEGYALACEALASSQDPDWRAVKADTKILCGKEDKVASPAVCEAIKANLTFAKVELETWENVGHWHMLENVSGSAKVLRKVMAG